MSTLTSRTAAGFGWMLLGGGGQLFAQIGVVAVLARLVTPAEFGLVAAALVVVNMLQIVADAGIGPALVQRPEIDRAHIRVGFTLSLLLALVLWGLTWVTAPQLADLLGVDEVAPYIPALCFALVLQNATIGDYLLSRELRFQRVATVEFSSYLLGYGVVAIAMALAGFGAWSIVGGQLGQSTVRLVLLWIVSPHPVRPLIRRAEARNLLGYGTGHVLAKGGHFVATQADNIVVARVLGPAALGLYSRAFQFMTLPGLVFGRVVDRVLFPAMAKVQDDENRLANAWLRGLNIVATVVLPLSATVVVLRREIVLILLGPDWTDAIPAVAILAFGMLFRASYRLSDSLTRAVGAVYRRAWRSWLFALSVLVGAVVGVPWDIAGVSAGVLGALALNFALMTSLGGRLVHVRWPRILGVHVPGLVLAGVAAAAAWLAQQGMERVVTNPFLVAPVAVLVAVAATITALRVLAARRLLGVEETAAIVHAIVGRRLARLATMVVGPPPEAPVATEPSAATGDRR